MAYKRFLPKYSLGLFWESGTPHYNTILRVWRHFMYGIEELTQCSGWKQPTAHSSYQPEKSNKNRRSIPSNVPMFSTVLTQKNEKKSCSRYWYIPNSQHSQYVLFSLQVQNNFDFCYLFSGKNWHLLAAVAVNIESWWSSDSRRRKQKGNGKIYFVHFSLHPVLSSFSRSGKNPHEPNPQHLSHE